MGLRKKLGTLIELCAEIAGDNEGRQIFIAESREEADCNRKELEATLALTVPLERSLAKRQRRVYQNASDCLGLEMQSRSHEMGISTVHALTITMADDLRNHADKLSQEIGFADITCTSDALGTTLPLGQSDAQMSRCMDSAATASTGSRNAPSHQHALVHQAASALDPPLDKENIAP